MIPKRLPAEHHLVRLMYELMISGMGWDKVKQALEIEKIRYGAFIGTRKGQKFVNSEISLFRNLVKIR